MISRSDILKGEKIPDQMEISLGVLLHRLNMLRQYVHHDIPDFEFKISSGYRTMIKHRQIYAKKGIFDDNKIPMKSRHLTCQAADILDLDGKLQDWINKKVPLVEEIGLWFEDFSKTKDWVHCQIVAPASGKRFFLP